MAGKGNYRKAGKALEKAGFKMGRRFYRDRGKRFWFFPDNKKAAAIHLHKICGWAGIGYLNPEQIWMRKRTKEIEGYEIDLPSFEDELLISALHSVFENKGIKKDEFFYLVHLIDEQELDWDYIKKTSRSVGCLTAFRIFWRFFQEARKKEDAVFPFPIVYREILKAKLARLGHDLRHLHFASFIKDFFSYILDIGLDILKGSHL